MFSPVPTSIADILNAQAQFAIPIYQREYKWGKEEATELIEDLKNFRGIEGDGLFLGNLIFKRAENKKSFVVDGQQRLTTLLILLVACRERAKELSRHSLVAKIQERITFVDPATAESLGTRLIASESVRDIFEHIAKEDWKGDFPATSSKKKQIKRQVNRLKPIYDYFSTQMKELSADGLSEFLRAIYDAYAIKIEIDGEEEALSIFERTNARGLDLEVSDLLKNFLFAKKVERVEDLWKEITENAGGSLLRMLKYFYVSKRGYVLKPHLYKKLKSYAEETGPQEFTDQLRMMSKFYYIVRDPSADGAQELFEALELSELASDRPKLERVCSTLLGLREFNVIQFCPVAFSALECCKRNGGSTSANEAKALVRLFEVFEKYHFINNRICDRVGNEVEKLYAETCVKYATSTDFAKTTEDLINDLRRQLAKEDEFVAKFVDELHYSQDQLSILAYVFDRINNYGLAPGQEVRIYDPDPKIRRRSHNIEHFFPQNPTKEGEGKKERPEWLHSIGNLLAVSIRANGKLGNGSPKEKIERLNGELCNQIQNLAHVRDFVREYGPMADKWDREQVLSRAKAMAKDAYRRVWRF